MTGSTLFGAGFCRIENCCGVCQRMPVKSTSVKAIAALVLALALLAGCKHSRDLAAAVDGGLPKQAQPKLPTMKIYLGAEMLDAELALTQEQETTGMMFRTNIAETDAMIFVFGQPMRAAFWMKNCPESLSAAYIAPDGVIAEIHHLEKNDTNAVFATADNIQYVLEVKDGWFARHNINPGTVVRTEKGSLGETFFPR